MLVVLSLGGITPPASAWQLELKGSFNWTYEFYSQTGSKGFFGPYNVDTGVGGRAGNLNFWSGGQFDTHIVSSAQAAWSYFNVEFEPTFTLNKAIRFTAKYRFGTYGDHVASDYHTFDSPGANVGIGEGMWTMFWVTVQTPVGIFGVGKRPWTFGSGLQYDGENATTTESLSLVVPYGPFDLGIAFYPYRFAGSSSIRNFTVYDPYVSQFLAFQMNDSANSYAVPFDPYNLPFRAFQWALFLTNQYYSRADSSGRLAKDFLVFLTYQTGPVYIGITSSFLSYHLGPEGVLQPSFTLKNFPLLAWDSDVLHGSGFVKYNNGRFFFNGEGAWLYWTDRWSADPTGLEVGPPNPRYVEQWRYMVETGTMAGPVKVSLLHAWTPGPDRRAGTLIGKQPATFVWHHTFDRILGNFDVFRPYSYLFSYDYGGGLAAYDMTGDGYVRDAAVFAARLDYAVAANLNVYGSFLYANRTSNGYSWGCIGPNVGEQVDQRHTFMHTPDGNIGINLNRYPASPNIPDTSLGYEVNLGMEWQLLENMTAGVVLGYWRPGRWFNYACIDRSVPNWEVGTAANNFGTKPDRSLDPIVGGSINLTFDF